MALMEDERAADDVATAGNRMTQRRAAGSPSAPAPKSPSSGSSDSLSWTDGRGHKHKVGADENVRTLHLERARPDRRAPKFPQRRNYEGLFWFASTGTHVWFESLFERSALLVWDHQQDIVGIAAQPFKLVLARDGHALTHWPDYFAVRSNGDQVVFDIRPRKRLDAKTLESFRRTAQFCDRVGWDYEIFTEIDPVFKANLEWLSGYRHTRHLPDRANELRAVEIFAQPRTIEDGCALFFPEFPAMARPYVYNLIWRQKLRTDLSVPLTSQHLLTAVN